jgi:hypothetical protein
MICLTNCLEKLYRVKVKLDLKLELGAIRVPIRRDTSYPNANGQEARNSNSTERLCFGNRFDLVYID